MHNYPFSTNAMTTKLKTGYGQMIQAHVFRDWIAGHPKIVLPIVVFLLGSLTYAVRTSCFDYLFMGANTTVTDI